MMKRLSAAFSAAFIFISIFANCLHTPHIGKFTAVIPSCETGQQAAHEIVASGKSLDGDADCAACYFLLSAQGAYFAYVSLPETQPSEKPSLSEPKFIHNNSPVEHPARAPPYFPV